MENRGYSIVIFRMYNNILFLNSGFRDGDSLL